MTEEREHSTRFLQYAAIRGRHQVQNFWLKNLSLKVRRKCRETSSTAAKFGESCLTEAYRKLPRLQQFKLLTP